ncbi:hypothetical protein EI94DRAFT_1705871 [Lactarius quietus]|nr:hypothetical protein EI94DRAFT_1705871 [Lactarius quietus]
MDATPLSPSPALPQPHKTAQTHLASNSPPENQRLSSLMPPGGRSRIVWLLLQLKPGRKRSNANSNASGNASSAGDQSLTQMTTPTETDLTPVITSIKVPAEAIHTPMVPTPPPINQPTPLHPLAWTQTQMRTPPRAPPTPPPPPGTQAQCPTPPPTKHNGHRHPVAVLPTCNSTYPLHASFPSRDNMLPLLSAENIDTDTIRGQVEADRKDPIVGPLMLRNTLDKFTLGLMPHVQDTHPTSIFQYLDLDIISDWETLQRGKLIALPFDNKAWTCANHKDIKGRIMAVVADITKSQEVGVATPRVSIEAVRAKRTPTAFLVYNLTAEQANMLLECRIWSTLAISFRVTMLGRVYPDFLFTISQLGTMTPGDVEELIKGVWSDDETSQFIIGLVNIYPNDEKEQVYMAIQELLTSFYLTRLDIKRAGDSLIPQYNVYANRRKAIKLNIWSRIRHFLADRKYSARYLGTGTTDTKPFHCGICSSVDHPRGLCPFPGVEGWKGPKRRVNKSMRGRNGNYRGIVFRTPGARASGSNGRG